MLRIGIDEAGYGPTLGPLAVVAAAAEAEQPAAFASALADLGVADSKRVHRSGELAPLERVALPGAAWLSGTAPANAAQFFALIGEPAASRATAPWMAGAEDLRLPLAASGLPAWHPPGRARGLYGRLLHPADLNAARRRSVNRAAAELEAVRDLLMAALPDPSQSAEVACDRLGGRKRYGDLLTSAWPSTRVEIIEETAPACCYRCHQVGIAFLVGGEEAEPLIALASCIAKYARELHMHLLNRYWCDRLPELAPTAGYPEDAKRWLQQLGEAHLTPNREQLVRL